jgi:hypothetical protein
MPLIVEKLDFTIKYITPTHVSFIKEYQFLNDSTKDIIKEVIIDSEHFDNHTSLNIIINGINDIPYEIINKNGREYNQINELKIFLPGNVYLNPSGRIQCNLSYDILSVTNFYLKIDPYYRPYFEIPLNLRNCNVTIVGDSKYQLNVIDYIVDKNEDLIPVFPSKMEMFSIFSWKKLLGCYYNLPSNIKRPIKYFVTQLKELNIINLEKHNSFFPNNSRKEVRKIIFHSSIQYRCNKCEENIKLLILPWQSIKPDKGLWFLMGLLSGFLILCINLKYFSMICPDYTLLYIKEKMILNITKKFDDPIKVYTPILAFTSCIISGMYIIRGWIISEAQDQLPEIPFKKIMDLIKFSNDGSKYFYLLWLIPNWSIRRYSTFYAIIIFLNIVFVLLILNYLLKSQFLI